MARPDRGLHEVLITDNLEAQLRELANRMEVHRRPLRTADAADRIALHLARIVERSLDGLPDEDRVEKGIALAN